MTSVVASHLAFLLMAVLQIKTSGGSESGFILLSCSDVAREDSAAGPCLLRGHSTIRRDDYSYTPGIGGHKLHTRAASWNDARRTCDEEGGHLAIINSVAEANAITDLCNKSGAVVGGTGSPDWVFIGFHDLYQEGEYVTIHGHSLARSGFTQWADQQPDNAGGAENCGSVHRKGGLNDITCTGKYGFICELPI